MAHVLDEDREVIDAIDWLLESGYLLLSERLRLLQLRRLHLEFLGTGRPPADTAG